MRMVTLSATSLKITTNKLCALEFTAYMVVEGVLHISALRNFIETCGHGRMQPF